jgi:hypothetical protein
MSADTAKTSENRWISFAGATTATTGLVVLSAWQFRCPLCEPRQRRLAGQGPKVLVTSVGSSSERLSFEGFASTICLAFGLAGDAASGIGCEQD